MDEWKQDAASSSYHTRLCVCVYMCVCLCLYVTTGEPLLLFCSDGCESNGRSVEREEAELLTHCVHSYFIPLTTCFLVATHRTLMIPKLLRAQAHAP